ncbi:hypothetical protein OSTOST_10863, partial [Ostertagia ostertagi]
INCVIALFCVALSNGWTSRLASVIGLIFTLLSLIFIGGAIATLFAWNLADMSLPKAFCFISVGFAVVDIVLNFFFYYRRHTVAPTSVSIPPPEPRPPSPSIIEEKYISASISLV